MGQEGGSEYASESVVSEEAVSVECECKRECECECECDREQGRQDTARSRPCGMRARKKMEMENGMVMRESGSEARCQEKSEREGDAGYCDGEDDNSERGPRGW